MPYTLLAMVDQACGELGLSQPAAVVGTSINQTAQMLALVQRLGRDLSRVYEWRRLVRTHVFQSTAAVSTTGTTTSASAVITAIPTTASIAAGYVVSGNGIPPFAQVVSVDSGTQVTLDMPATATGSAVALTFADQDYSLPADFDRMISDTQWNRTDHWRNLGAQSSQSWQWLTGGVISAGSRYRFRLYDGNLRLSPAPTAVMNFAYEYVSIYWVIATGGTTATKSALSVDTDTAVFPDDLMLAGLKYYFLKAKKLDFAAERADFEEILSDRKAQDSPATKLTLAPVPSPELIGPWNVPEGSWDL